MSERSRWFHVDTPAAPEPEEEQAAEPPDKPRGLEATATHDSVTLTWDDPQDDSITGYVILRRIPAVDPQGQFSELVSDTGTDATTYTDDTVSAETRYTYRIKAINEHGVSERSRWSHINVPAAPEAAEGDDPDGEDDGGGAPGGPGKRANVSEPSGEDCPRTTATTCEVDVGGSATGNITTGGDQDWFKVVLEAGKTYQIDLKGEGGGGGTLEDPLLDDIRDSSGDLIDDTFNNDIDFDNDIRDSRIIFSPTEAGTYYLVAGDAIDEAGTYTLSVSEVETEEPPCTLNDGDIWCGVVDVGEVRSTADVLTGHGFVGITGRETGGLAGHPDDTMFSVGDNDYTIQGIYVGAGTNNEGALFLLLTADLSDDDEGILVLAFDGVTTLRPLDDATKLNTGLYHWSTDLDWSSTTEVTVRLQTPSDDADDPPVTLPTLSIAAAEGDEDDGVEFTATLTAGVSGKVTATWTATIESGDTAVAADLAMTKTGDVEFAENATSAKFTVPVNDDTIDEDNETFTVTLSGVSSNAQLAADPTAKGTILDDDDPPCTLNYGDIWCGVVTVGTVEVNGVRVLYGFTAFVDDTPAGDLVDDTGDRDFTTDNDSYTVERIYVGAAGNILGTLYFGMDKNFHNDDEETLVLHIEVDGTSTEWAIDDSARGGGIGRLNLWQSSGLDWSSVTEVTVRLRVPSSDLPADTSTTGTVEVDGSAVRGDIYEPVEETVTWTTIDAEGDEVEKEGTVYDFDTDWFAVDLKAGRTYRIDMKGETPDDDLTLHLPEIHAIYDADGVDLPNTSSRDATDDANNSHHLARVEFTPEDDGTYYIAATGESFEWGSYELTVIDITQDDDEHPPDRSTTVIVVVGTPVTGKIDFNRDVDWFKLLISVEDRYQIDLEGQETDSGSLRDPLLRGVYDADGNYISGTRNDDGGEVFNARISRTLKVGIYYVAVGAFGNGEGTYTLTVTY